MTNKISEQPIKLTLDKTDVGNPLSTYIETKKDEPVLEPLHNLIELFNNNFEVFSGGIRLSIADIISAMKMHENGGNVKTHEKFNLLWSFINLLEKKKVDISFLAEHQVTVQYSLRNAEGKSTDSGENISLEEMTNWGTKICEFKNAILAAEEIQETTQAVAQNTEEVVNYGSLKWPPSPKPLPIPSLAKEDPALNISEINSTFVLKMPKQNCAETDLEIFKTTKIETEKEDPALNISEIDSVLVRRTPKPNPTEIDLEMFKTTKIETEKEDPALSISEIDSTLVLRTPKPSPAETNTETPSDKEAEVSTPSSVDIMVDEKNTEEKLSIASTAIDITVEQIDTEEETSVPPTTETTVPKPQEKDTLVPIKNKIPIIKLRGDPGMPLEELFTLLYPPEDRDTTVEAVDRYDDIKSGDTQCSVRRSIRTIIIEAQNLLVGEEAPFHEFAEENRELVFETILREQSINFRNEMEILLEILPKIIGEDKIKEIFAKKKAPMVCPRIELTEEIQTFIDTLYVEVISCESIWDALVIYDEIEDKHLKLTIWNRLIQEIYKIEKIEELENHADLTKKSKSKFFKKIKNNQTDFDADEQAFVLGAIVDAISRDEFNEFFSKSNSDAPYLSPPKPSLPQTKNNELIEKLEEPTIESLIKMIQKSIKNLEIDGIAKQFEKLDSALKYSIVKILLTNLKDKKKLIKQAPPEDQKELKNKIHIGNPATVSDRSTIIMLQLLSDNSAVMENIKNLEKEEVAA